ncbi:hypothetical protein OFB47_33315, partial [Escherichia coli]|nr:hypothetical protein [Escherichia coli]
LVIARTKKGRGVSFLEDQLGKHGKPVPPDQAEQAIRELGGERDITVEVARPERRPEPPVRSGFVGEYEPKRWEVGDSEATRT